MRAKSATNEAGREVIISSQLPVPIYTVKCKMLIVDHVKEQIEKKKTYTNQREINFVKLHQQYKRNVINEENEMTSLAMKNFVEGSFKDPAPHVKGIDWNFNRSSLGIIERDDKSFIVTPYTKGSFKFIELQSKNLLSTNESTKNGDRFVNELMTSEKFIATRHKKSINVVNLSKLEDIKDEDVIETCDKYEYKTVDELIASAIFNDQLIVLDSNLNLVKYDISTKGANFTFRMPINTSRLSVLPYSVNAINETKVRTNISFTNALELGFIDCRVKAKGNTQTFSFENHFAMQCENILNHTFSKINDNLVYVVSNHMLYGIDYRQMKHPLLRWAHQIKKSPMMMSTSLYGGSEMICLSSSEVGDLKVFNFDGNCFNHLPFTPKSIVNSYNNLCEDGHFLLSNIRDRIKLSTTGIALKSDVQKLRIRLFTQNVAGDIFESFLNCHKNCQNTYNAYDYFKDWSDHIDDFKDPNEYLTVTEKLERKDLIVDDIVRVDGIAKIFTCDDLQSRFAVEEDDNLHIQRHPEWKISIEKARNYKDLLAKEIMNIWDDIDIEELKPQLFADALDATEQTRENSADRITRWLKASNNENVIIEEISFSENVELPQDHSTQATAGQIDTQEVAMVIKSSKVKKPRVAGF